MVELELAGALVDEALFGVDGHHVGHEHVVAAEVLRVEYLALDVERALCDERGFDHLCGLGVEAHLAELVVVATATHTAPVGGAGQSLGGEVDDELARAAYDGVTMALRTHADIAHGRVAAKRTRPCDGDDVVCLWAVAAADHDGRQRVD